MQKISREERDHIKKLRSELKYLIIKKERAQDKDSSMYGLPRGTDVADTAGNMASHLADIDAEIRAKWNELKAAAAIIQTRLKEIAPDNIYNVLVARVLDGKSFRKIAATTSRSEAWVRYECKKYID